MQMYLYKYIVDYLQQIRLLCKTLLQWLNLVLSKYKLQV